MKTDEVMQEVLRIKCEMAEENGMDFDRVVASIHAFNKACPPPPTPARRKFLEGHPVGRSVWRDDETLAELRAVKEELGTRYKSAGALGEAARRFSAEHPLAPTPKSRKLIEGFPKGQSVSDIDEVPRKISDGKQKRKAPKSGKKPAFRSSKALKTRHGK